MQRLFVYGSLGPGRPNEHVLGALGGAWEEAFVRGTLQAQGWGAAMGYPGLLLSAEGEEIAGFLFSSDNLDGQWADLDAFEGDEYERVRTTVRTKDNNAIEAYVYVLRAR